MNKKEIEECKEELRQWLIKWTKGCNIQTGGWSCGTCTIWLLKQLGVRESGNYNKPRNRLNEVWRAILQIRGDKEA